VVRILLKLVSDRGGENNFWIINIYTQMKEEHTRKKSNGIA
jgi:hypothetical protein